MKKTQIITKQLLFVMGLFLTGSGAVAQSKDSVIHKNALQVKPKPHSTHKKAAPVQQTDSTTAVIQNNDSKIKDSILKKYKF